jgi:hypothetical protein
MRMSLQRPTHQHYVIQRLTTISLRSSILAAESSANLLYRMCTQLVLMAAVHADICLRRPQALASLL